MSHASSPASVPRAIVIGGSLSGLLAGLLLQRAGWRVDIYERVARDLAGRGAGIVTHQPLCDALDAARISWRDNLGVDVVTRRLFGVSGELISELTHRQTMTAWDRLYALLRAAFPGDQYHRGMEVVGLDQTVHEVTAKFSDGSHVSAELLLGCDGLRSTLRALLLPQVQPLYAGYVAWRSLVAEDVMPPDLRDDIFAHFSFCLPPGEQMLGYPVAGPNNDLRPGRRRYNLVWYRPADESTLQRLLTDDSGHVHSISIPPPAVSERAIADMHEAAGRILSPQFRACWQLADRPFIQAIYDVESPRLAFGRIAMLGDAAFVARPHCGVGVTKAAEDALVLTRILSDATTVADALCRYEAARLPFGERVIAQARWLGSYMHAPAGLSAPGQTAAPPISPEVILRETASIDFLAAPD